MDNNTLTIDGLIEHLMNSNLNETMKVFAKLLIEKAIEAERDEYIQAGRYERETGRKDYRNGAYKRDFVTPYGKIELEVARTRSGEFSPSVLKRYAREDEALVLAMIEAVISGVSTRKVTKIVHALCGENVSKSKISDLLKQIDPEIAEFRHRTLTHSVFQYVYIDAMYIKVREDCKVKSKAVYIALGVNEDSKREIIGFMVDEPEKASTWTHFLQTLREKGLVDPKIIISDAHEGIIKATKEVFPNTRWQRCTVHLLRNIIESMPRKGTQVERELLSSIFKQPTLQHAIEAKEAFIQLVKDNPKMDRAVNILENGFDSATQYYSAPLIHAKHLRTTNVIERVNQEIRKRESCFRIFANLQSAERLIGAILLSIHDKWQQSRRPYLQHEREVQKKG